LFALTVYLVISVYINHRPAFGLSPDKLLQAFETLGLPGDKGSSINRGDLLEMLQTKGKKHGTLLNTMALVCNCCLILHNVQLNEMLV